MVMKKSIWGFNRRGCKGSIGLISSRNEETCDCTENYYNYYPFELEC